MDPNYDEVLTKIILVPKCMFDSWLFIRLLTCGMMVRVFLRRSRSILMQSTPSRIYCDFSSGSNKRKSDRANEDFPLPVRPQIPTFWPFSIFNSRLSKAGGLSFLQMRLKFFSSSLPFCGQESAKTKQKRQLPVRFRQ